LTESYCHFMYIIYRDQLINQTFCWCLIRSWYCLHFECMCYPQFFCEVCVAHLFSFLCLCVLLCTSSFCVLCPMLPVHTWLHLRFSLTVICIGQASTSLNIVLSAVDLYELSNEESYIVRTMYFFNSLEPFLGVPDECYSRSTIYVFI
jgi:hypothetical protein